MRSTDRATLTCRIGALAAHAHAVILVDVTADRQSPVNTSSRFSVALQPVAPDTYPATRINAKIDTLGISNLRTTITPADVSAVVGHSVTLRVKVHNGGQSRAPNVIGFSFLEPRGPFTKNDVRPHFRVTNAPNPSADGVLGDIGSDTDSGSGGSVAVEPASGDSAAMAAAQMRSLQADVTAGRAAATLDTQPSSSSSSSASAAPSAPASDTRDEDSGGVVFIGGGSVGLWPLGTIAPGRSAAVSVTLKALRPGRDTLDFDAFSLSQGGCSNESGCDAEATASLRAVAVPTATQPGAILSDTGARTIGPTLYLALLALVSGIVLTTSARPKRPARHRR